MELAASCSEHTQDIQDTVVCDDREDESPTLSVSPQRFVRQHEKLLDAMRAICRVLPLLRLATEVEAATGTHIGRPGFEAAERGAPLVRPPDVGIQEGGFIKEGLGARQGLQWGEREIGNEECEGGRFVACMEGCSFNV